ncbi:MAG TPA: gamma-glutamylcyclotransferase family protein [Kofleriaceae bacterium]|nr:gamma-glutamylcyclotransferase family protein [Kofleriaceae bacterium]
MDERRRSAPEEREADDANGGEGEGDDRLFVYGSLREGQSARSLIAGQIARCERATAAGAIYVLPSGYSALVEVDAEPSARVVGEVVWLADLAATFARLDDYEGVDYTRALRLVQLETGEQIASWIYVLADPGALEHGTRIDHGDWVRYLRERE